MKRLKYIFVTLMIVLCLSSCSFGSLFYVNLEGSAKGIEVYCEKINDDYKCRACEGTNRNKTDDEIKRLYPIKLEDMKDLLENKNQIDCSRIILIEINDGDVELLSVKDHFDEYEFLNNYFGK